MKLRPQDVAICLLLIMWTVNYDVSRAPWLAPKHASQSLCSVTCFLCLGPQRYRLIQTGWKPWLMIHVGSCWFKTIETIYKLQHIFYYNIYHILMFWGFPSWHCVLTACLLLRGMAIHGAVRRWSNGVCRATPILLCRGEPRCDLWGRCHGHAHPSWNGVS